MWPERFTTAAGRLAFQRPEGPAPARLLGLNRSGLQHKPSLAAAGFPDPERELLAWRTVWNAQVLRVPLALDLLLEEHAYRDGVARLVDAAAAAGLYLILELHGLTSDLALALPPPEADEGWRVLASAHGSRAHVIFDLWNEPHGVDWRVWAARAQELIEVVRAAGAGETLVLASGVDWGYDLRALRDPRQCLDGQGGPLAYAAHVYPFKTGHLRRERACERSFGRAARMLPVLVTEFGVLPGRTGLGRFLARVWLTAFLRYLDTLGLSALAWSAGDLPHVVLGGDGQDVRLPDNPPDPEQPTASFGTLVRDWMRAPRLDT